ncbi:dihydroorotate dehydrogenase electron transfer subunit [Ornithinibacillus sp. 4-3]|uniref:Dihydroorotate dehydrogenase B (NAD(+)), electron transfer subunit n=1 Tax=Ornithinibacillus sp. 4-3 TaxID=3231488 RepID=A0AB39HV54_9BACI
MRKEQLRIIDMKNIALDTFELRVENSYISQTAVPGQFVHISIDNRTLRRPISIATIDRDNEIITLIFKVVGAGTHDLSTYAPGKVLDALGPCGNGFPIDDVKENETILLVGGGVGVPPIHFLGQALAEKNVRVISVLGYQTKESVFFEEEFKAISETHIVTNDGTHGQKGFVTNVLEEIGEFDRYYTCGPLPMLQAVTKQLAYKEGFISLEERMGCGVGACFACVIPTDEQGGYVKICQDGPVFAAQEVII